tara:strand:+ start:36019 stop:36246 length:228 start_codon:yes stop_codon:yes gene_type:complete
MGKFTHITIETKKLIKAVRIQEGYNMNEFAEKVGISRKKLEDIEAVRDYGCFLDLDMLKRISDALNSCNFELSFK